MQQVPKIHARNRAPGSKPAEMGTINAGQVNAGAFSGCSLPLNKNGTTTTIDNLAIYGGNAVGIEASSTSTRWLV